MIVICPECATRYLIDPRALGVMGRSVRCTHCSHVWMQLPPEDAPRRVDLPLPGTEKPQAARPAPQARALPPPPQSAPPAPPKITPVPQQVAAPPPAPARADAAGNTAARRGSPVLVIALLAIAISRRPLVWPGFPARSGAGAGRGLCAVRRRRGRPGQRSRI